MENLFITALGAFLAAIVLTWLVTHRPSDHDERRFGYPNPTAE